MAGIYLHVPFCKQRCSYCDFHFSTRYEGYRNRLIKALVDEIHLRKGEINEPIESIYFGGGTPSLLKREEIEQLVHALKTSFLWKKSIEFTVEVNPDDMQPERLRTWFEAGCNRLSVGIQSFNDADLQWMNRAHKVSDVYAGMKTAKEVGFTNLSIDLIYGLPNSTLQSWEDNIQYALEMDVQHISAYCLTVEPKTLLHQHVKKGVLQPPGEDAQSDQFLLLVEKLQTAGFLQYEISNFSLPAHQAVHNSNYWRGKPYLGIGPSAHSYDGKMRRWNVSNNAAYMNGVGKTDDWFEEEVLSKRDVFNETLLTRLRTSEGLPTEELFVIHSPPSDFNSKIAEYRQRGWLSDEGNVLVLTRSGRLVADGIAASLFIDKD
jgi:oxygen-independent coproporphyrinogen-3 oxidase